MKTLISNKFKMDEKEEGTEMEDVANGEDIGHVGHSIDEEAVNVEEIENVEDSINEEAVNVDSHPGTSEVPNGTNGPTTESPFKDPSPQWEYEALLNEEENEKGFRWEYVDMGGEPPPLDSEGFTRLLRLRQQQLDNLLGESLAQWRVLIKRRRKQGPSKPVYDGYFRTPGGRIIRTVQNLENQAAQCRPSGETRTLPVVRKHWREIAPPVPQKRRREDPRKVAASTLDTVEVWDDEQEELLFNKYNLLAMLHARLKGMVQSEKKKKVVFGQVEEKVSGQSTKEKKTGVYLWPAAPRNYPRNSITYIKCKEVSGVGEKSPNGDKNYSCDNLPEEKPEETSTETVHRLRELPSTRANYVGEGGRPSHGPKRRRKEGPDRHVAMLSWTVSEAGVGLQGRGSSWSALIAHGGREPKMEKKKTNSLSESKNVVRILHDRECGESAQWGRGVLQPKSNIHSEDSSRNNQEVTGIEDLNCEYLKTEVDKGTSVDVTVDDEDVSNRESTVQAKKESDLLNVRGKACEGRREGNDCLDIAEKSWRSFASPIRRKDGGNKVCKGVLRPDSINRPGKRWISYFQGWQSVQQQWEAPGVVLQRASYKSWTPTWGAYTSNFAATPTANRDQGVQKVLDVRFHPNGGAQLVCGCNAAPNELLLYDLETGRAKELAGHGCQIQAVEFAKDGDLIVSCGANMLKVWDTSTGDCLHTMGPPNPLDCSVDVPGHRKKISAMAVNKWRPWLVASSGGPGDLRLLLWNASQGELISDLNASLRESENYNMAMDALDFANGNTLVCGSDCGEGMSSLAVVQTWDIEQERVVLSFPAHNKFITSLHIDPNSDVIITGSGDGTVGLFDMRSEAPIGRLPIGPHCEVTSVSFSSCGRYFQASSVANCTLVWDVRMLSLSPSPPPSLTSLTGNATSTTQSTILERGSRSLHCLSHGRPMPTIENAGQLPGFVDEGDEGVNDAKWFHGSPCLVTVSGNGSMALWDVSLGQPCVHHICAHSRSINTTAISSDDLIVCTGGDDQKVVLYQPVEKPGNLWRLTHPLYDFDTIGS